MAGGKLAEDESDSYHVLETVITVGGIVKTALVCDAQIFIA
jgi:hypothetical protein